MSTKAEDGSRRPQAESETEMGSETKSEAEAYRLTENIDHTKETGKHIDIQETCTFTDGAMNLAEHQNLSGPR